VIPVFVYVGLMVLVNWMYGALPMVSTPWGPWSGGSLVVGAVFISRDYAQRAVGPRWVLVPMAVGLALSCWAAPPGIALSSGLAFAASEGMEWLIFTITRKPFRERVLLSVAVAVPVDTLVFLGGIGGLSAAQFAIMCCSKFLALAWIWLPRPRTSVA
jgi:queuosine precursor transporter